jgi:hypothetical protein
MLAKDFGFTSRVGSARYSPQAHHGDRWLDRPRTGT